MNTNSIFTNVFVYIVNAMHIWYALSVCDKKFWNFWSKTFHLRISVSYFVFNLTAFPTVASWNGKNNDKTHWTSRWMEMVGYATSRSLHKIPQYQILGHYASVNSILLETLLNFGTRIHQDSDYTHCYKVPLKRENQTTLFLEHYVSDSH